MAVSKYSSWLKSYVSITVQHISLSILPWQSWAREKKKTTNKRPQQQNNGKQKPSKQNNRIYRWYHSTTTPKEKKKYLIFYSFRSPHRDIKIKHPLRENMPKWPREGEGQRQGCGVLCMCTRMPSYFLPFPIFIACIKLFTQTNKIRMAKYLIK